MLSNPAVPSAIIGATSEQQLRGALPGAGLTLPPAVLEQLDAASAV